VYRTVPLWTGYAQAMRVLPSLRDHVPMERVQEEELLQIRQRRQLLERRIRPDLVIRQKPHRHRR
jgi:hypothetical protein